MKVLVIVEDPTLDQFIAKPIVEHHFVEIGRRARVEVLSDPHLRGIDQALDPDVVGEIVANNPMEDLFVLLVDRDCNRCNSEQRAADRESEHPGKIVFGVALEELEVWMLPLHRKLLSASWSDVREHCDPKEAYADPFLKAQG